tara:strand:+ start:42 stop:362 length:321 start_codon:yes stop_codon:yes gene_type:complete
MFCVLLLIITLLSSFGGGIRYRENFLEEVFDLNDVTDFITDTKNYFPINFSTSVTEETNNVVSEKKIEEEAVPQIPIKLEEPSPVVPGSSTFDIIEAYTGEAFAAF